VLIIGVNNAHRVTVYRTYSDLIVSSRVGNTRSLRYHHVTRLVIRQSLAHDWSAESFNASLAIYRIVHTSQPFRGDHLFFEYICKVKPVLQVSVLPLFASFLLGVFFATLLRNF
jgi:hypothetical protein